MVWPIWMLRTGIVYPLADAGCGCRLDCGRNVGPIVGEINRSESMMSATSVDFHYFDESTRRLTISKW